MTPVPSLPCGALVSAHRGGAKSFRTTENSIEAFTRAASSGVDLIEFDVHVTSDEQFIVSHSPKLATGHGRVRVASRTLTQLRAEGASVVAVADVCAVLPTSVTAHVDIKFACDQKVGSGSLHRLANLIHVALGHGRYIFTSTNLHATATLATWCAANGVPNCVGLSLWMPLSRAGSRGWGAWSQLLPSTRFARSGAGFIVVHHALARLGVLRWAANNKIKVLVWTCDSERRLRMFLNDSRVWAVTSNDPVKALGLRVPVGLPVCVPTRGASFGFDIPGRCVPPATVGDTR